MEKSDHNSTKSVSFQSEDVEVLMKNYEKLEEFSIEREEKIKEMERYIDDLEYSS